MNEREYLSKRHALVTRARAIQDLAEKENRDFTAEEQTNWDQIWADEAALTKAYERSKKLAGFDEEPTAEPVRPDGGQPANEQEARHIEAWNAFLRSGSIRPELRALQADSDAMGGYYTAPQQFVNKLIKAIDDQVWMRQWATPNTVTSSQSLGAPYLAADPADSDWTSELGTGNEDSTMSFGKRELAPKPLAKRIKVSNKLLRLSPDVESLVIARLAYKFAITAEKAYLTGNGAAKPLGVFTASADGISTGRDVSTGNTATSIQFDGIKEAKYTLKGGYWSRAKWLFHRDALKQISKLQDDTGRYIWQPAVTLGSPDMLEGVPVFMSEYAPNTFTTGLYVGIIGDFSNYWTADALDFSTQRLNELYAATNQTGFIGRLESDGMPVLEEAFVRVKLA